MTKRELNVKITLTPHREFTEKQKIGLNDARRNIHNGVTS